MPHSSSHNGSSDSPGLSVPPGYDLRVYEEVDSTNEEARRLAQSGVSQPTWIWAKRQTAGRGRRGREWVSLSGNLFCTLLLPLEQKLVVAAQLSFVAALAVANYISSQVETSKVSMKWPNDVLWDGRKVSGILLESLNVFGSKRNTLAIGIGLNLLSYPTDTEFPAASLGEVMKSAGPGPALEKFMPLFDEVYRTWTDQGFSPIREAWLAKATGIGKTIEVRLPHETLSGVFDTISDMGELLLILPDGDTRKITAGEVFFKFDG